MGTIKIVEYRPPKGETRDVIIELPDDICKMAEKQIITCEVIRKTSFNPLGLSVVYFSRKIGEEPEAENTETPIGVDIESCLTRLIKFVDSRKFIKE